MTRHKITIKKGEEGHAGRGGTHHAQKTTTKTSKHA